MAKRDFIETPVGGSYPPAAPKSDFWPASDGSSDFEGINLLGGDAEVAGHKLVIGGPKIGEAPEDLFSYLNEITGKG
jgi:hypothetical protein